MRSRLIGLRRVITIRARALTVHNFGRWLVMLAAVLSAGLLASAAEQAGSKASGDAEAPGGSATASSMPGDLQASDAVRDIDLAAELATQGRHPEAEKLAAKAVAILRARRASALRGGFDPDTALTRARAYLDHGESFGFLLERYLQIAGTLAQEGDGSEALRSRAFMAAQELMASAPARSLAMAAARRTAPSAGLATLIRDQQTLTVQVLALERRLRAATANGDLAGAATLGAELQQGTQRLAEMNRRLNRKFPDYPEFISPLPLSIPQVRSALEPEEGLLLLFPSGQDLHIFAVGPESSAWHRIKNGVAPAAARVVHLRCQVDPAACDEPAGSEGSAGPEGAGRPPYDLKVAHALYADLLAPVEAPLRQTKVLHVVTAGFFGSLPLAMLVSAPPEPGADEADPATLLSAPWLANRYAFVQLPAVAGLRLKAVQRGSRFTNLLAAYGDPLLGAADAPFARGAGRLRAVGQDGPLLADPTILRTLPSLPGTRRELMAMATAMRAPTASLRLQSNATEGAVKRDPLLARSAIVVFATHGVLAGEVEGYGEPGLILTPPEVATVEDDGILTASEIAQLSLTADWVILSACNTGDSVGAAGPTSLSSLARGFLFAGARSLLASHWRVSDETTAALTVETLAVRRAQPTITRARALQAAMRTIRTGRRPDGSRVAGWQPDWGHPSAWAAFSYIASHDDWRGGVNSPVAAPE